MKKIILLMFTIALIVAACKKDEVQKFAIDKAEITLSHDGTAQLNASQKCSWSTSDSNVAIVSPAGLVTGVRIGDAKIIAVANGARAECMVKVAPESLLFVEPFFSYGSSPEAIKSKEFRLLKSETADALIYFGENSSVRNVMYLISHRALMSSVVLLQNSTSVAKEVTVFLNERYVFQGYSGGFYMYTNGIGVGMAINVDEDLGLNVIYAYTGKKNGGGSSNFKGALLEFKKNTVK